MVLPKLFRLFVRFPFDWTYITLLFRGFWIIFWDENSNTRLEFWDRGESLEAPVAPACFLNLLLLTFGYTIDDFVERAVAAGLFETDCCIVDAVRFSKLLWFNLTLFSFVTALILLYWLGAILLSYNLLSLSLAREKLFMLWFNFGFTCSLSWALYFSRIVSSRCEFISLSRCTYWFLFRLSRLCLFSRGCIAVRGFGAMLPDVLLIELAIDALRGVRAYSFWF